jgi:NitT/TauT family transport system permease protein
MRRIARGAVGVILLGLAWEVFARSRLFAPALTPTVETIARALLRMVEDGSLFGHALFTLYRVVAGLALAALVGIPLGMLMGRWRPAERFCLPLMSVLMPIPSLAWVPVFILWFGLGNTATIMLVFYAATFPLMYNTWTGVRSVNRLWLRAASAMGADERALFRKVVLPGALPFVITGLRQAFARSWIAVVGGEMIAASAWGLGWVLFDAKEFLNTDVMLGVLVVIGGLGLLCERVVFQPLEARTVARWGMLRAVKA